MLPQNSLFKGLRQTISLSSFSSALPTLVPTRHDDLLTDVLGGDTRKLQMTHISLSATLSVHPGADALLLSSAPPPTHPKALDLWPLVWISSDLCAVEGDSAASRSITISPGRAFSVGDRLPVFQFSMPLETKLVMYKVSYKLTAAPSAEPILHQDCPKETIKSDFISHPFFFFLSLLWLLQTRGIKHGTKSCTVLEEAEVWLSR